MTLRQVVEFMLAAIALSVMMTWLFHRTGLTLPIVMLFHCGINSTARLGYEPDQA